MPLSVRFGPRERFLRVQAFIHEARIVDHHDLVTALAIERENIFEREQIDGRLDLRPDLFADLAAERVHGAFAKLDPASERTVERFAFYWVIPLADEDSVPVAEEADGKRADLVGHG